MRKLAAAVVTLAALAAAAPVASAVPWPGWTDGQQMELRLLLAGINRQFQPDIITTAHQVCALRSDGRDPRPHLREAGYYEHQIEPTLAIMVDVTCP